MKVPFSLVCFAALAFIAPIGLFLAVIVLKRQLAERHKLRLLDADSRIQGLDPPAGSQDAWPKVLLTPASTPRVPATRACSCCSEDLPVANSRAASRSLELHTSAKSVQSEPSAAEPATVSKASTTASAGPAATSKMEQRHPDTNSRDQITIDIDADNKLCNRNCSSQLLPAAACRNSCGLQ
jgi:hypothetical protein